VTTPSTKKNNREANSGHHSRFLSPFRYPGGKSWFVKTALIWLKKQLSGPHILVEPFAGGACISLAAVEGGLVQKAEFAEIDQNVAATWGVILNGEAEWLTNNISNFKLNRKNVKMILAKRPVALRNRAFQCLLRNRTSRGGLLTKGAGLIREGEDGNGLLSRWYRDTLVLRVKTIAALKKKLKFTHGDGFSLIEKHKNKRQSVFFVDPPYTKAACRLYTHWKVNHERLFLLLSQVRGAVLMTYDDTAEIRRLAKKYGFQVKRISMTTTHHRRKRELMISKSFNWVK
jgi:DNA adenine methylase